MAIFVSFHLLIVQHLPFEILVHNISNVYKAKSNKFCEYIIPYRIGLGYIYFVGLHISIHRGEIVAPLMRPLYGRKNTEDY